MSKIIKEYRAKDVLEGAGVPVNRVFGYDEVPNFDPFLMLDYFEVASNVNSPGFPWHPHRGIETITYLLKGSVEHEDSIGNKGVIGPDELQWMTAGKGIFHQEMPHATEDGVQGFQFWLNMPAAKKMSEQRYQDIGESGLKHISEDGADIRLISGDFKGETGPIDKTELGVTMIHVKLKQGKKFSIMREKEKNGFIFAFSGQGYIEDDKIESYTAYTLKGGRVEISASDKDDLEFIYAEGKPIGESVAWRGPIVMNTKEELIQAFKDLEKGNFN